MAGDREEHPPAGASATNDSPERQGRVFKSVSHHMVMASPVGCDARLDGVVVVWLMLLCMAHTEEWVSVRYRDDDVRGSAGRKKRSRRYLVMLTGLMVVYTNPQ